MTDAARPSDRAEYIGIAVGAATVAVMAGVLWIVTAPLLATATRASLAFATAVSAMSAAQGIFAGRRRWRDGLIAALIQFVILWPLAWLAASYGSRHS